MIGGSGASRWQSPDWPSATPYLLLMVPPLLWAGNAGSAAASGPPAARRGDRRARHTPAGTAGRSARRWRHAVVSGRVLLRDSLICRAADNDGDQCRALANTGPGNDTRPVPAVPGTQTAAAPDPCRCLVGVGGAARPVSRAVERPDAARHVARRSLDPGRRSVLGVVYNSVDARPDTAQPDGVACGADRIRAPDAFPAGRRRSLCFQSGPVELGASWLFDFSRAGRRRARCLALDTGSCCRRSARGRRLPESDPDLRGDTWNHLSRRSRSLVPRRRHAGHCIGNSVDGGFDRQGEPTTDPARSRKGKTALGCAKQPIRHWLASRMRCGKPMRRAGYRVGAPTERSAPRRSSKWRKTASPAVPLHPGRGKRQSRRTLRSRDRRG